MARRHRAHRRPPSRRLLWALAIGLVALGALLWWWRHREQPKPALPVVSERQRLVAEARAALRADPNVADVVHTAAGDQWDVTPIADSTDATAFARYVCFVLEAQHVALPGTRVRVIDGATLEASGFDYNAASRGRLTCEAERR
ncbi:MAG TPA: hypothetical protein VM657_01560 [Sphingomonas sp.]|nr:hypothetical protein [Sphingomonas sp.]